MTQRYELSRRKTLAGLATVGAAGAGAGLGTSALFSDTETFEGNTITAGTLDMSVTASVEAANEYWEEQAGLEELEETADGGVVAGLQLEDVKPGDWGIVCFEIEVGDNPGYVQVTLPPGSIESNENGYTEPEPEDGKDQGELEENLQLSIYEAFTGDDSSPPDSYLDDEVVPPTTVRDALSTLAAGAPLGVAGPDDSIELCMLLEIPVETGNEIQSDSLSFDVQFRAEQVRNNDEPFNETGGN